MQPRQQKVNLFSLDRNARSSHFYPNLSTEMLGLFARTCKTVEGETAFLRLLIATINAEPQSYNQEDETKLATIAILKRHPELLFVKGVVTDHFGRKIFGSPYQLLLGAGDVWALEQVHKEIIQGNAAYAEKTQEQFQEQFPNCKLPFDPEQGEAAMYDDRNIAQVEQFKETLNKVVAAISVDPCKNGKSTEPETDEAIEELRQFFAPKENEVIRTGLHFPVAILQEVFRVYDVQFSLWPCRQLDFFSREVIGTVLAASTVVDGQSYKHGLSKMNFKKGPDRRDGLFCRHPIGIPAGLAPLNNKLGRTMFVDPYHGRSCFQFGTWRGCFNWYDKYGRIPGSAFRSVGAIGGEAGIWKTYVEEKKSELAKLVCGNPKPRPEPERSRCVIC